MKNKYFAFLILFLFMEIICICNAINASVAEDGRLTVPQIITKYGYPFKKYSVTTEDGYILSLFRIPNPGAMPVLLMHGFTGSSATYVLMGPDKGLAFILYRAGYDVWLFNARGCVYSQDHVDAVTISEQDYWNFSWHEIGVYDLPAVIDAIIAKTKVMKIFYVGYSQGATVFWVMCSERPNYSEKIELMQALSPIAYMGNSASPLLKYAAKVFWLIDKLGIVGRNKLVASGGIIKMFQTLACSALPIVNVFCILPIFLIAGIDYKQLDQEATPAIMGHGDQGASVKQFKHYVQLVKSSKFEQFDYGSGKNKLAYGQKNPPLYKLKNVKCKVILHYSQNDWVAAIVDVERLSLELPNVILKRLIMYPTWNHMDFASAKDVNIYVNKPVVDLFNNLKKK